MNISFKVKTPYTRSWLPTIHCGFVDTFHAAMNALESHLFAHMSFASPVELNGILLRPSSGEKSHLLLLFQLCFPFGYVRSIFILSSFIMTKRDSYIADLPSPRVLRMASSDIDMSNAGPHSTRHLPRPPGPDSHPQASSSHTHPSQRSTHVSPLQLPSTMHQGAPRQRIGHSILFKVIEQVLPSGHLSTSVLVEETDAQGSMKPKSLEFYFNGIIGHLRDRWGYALDTTTLCSQLANYWRSWFGAQAIGPVFETYPEPWVWENPEQSQPSTQADPTLTDPDHPIPYQILQVAWFLSALIEQHNAPLLQYNL